ncbi:hypothetical protein BVRB_030490 [Beta vulgaris subsp. vulgaris]|uniref:Vacuolar protein sorting-associated protein 13 VPS13 adaptor binding domain-containing protein n=1 Tax=Beta vulgaris subsp. vulgaris TaxID=3555 RepID=A0A0J8AXT0_BETVV|nr:hypothetical protein BVRB_030490 [Beta vulgaris subsp. vulgaris]
MIGSDSAFSPYYVRNETGDQVIYWLDTDANIRDTVVNGHEAPVKVVPYELLQASSRDTTSISLNLQVHGPWLPISGLKFDKVGAKRFVLAPTRNAPATAANMYLVADCSLLNGIKTLTLRSSLVIVNNLKVAVELYSSDQPPSVDLDRADPQRFGPVAPGQSLPVPLRLLHLDRIYIRPDQGSVRWSETPFSVTGLSRMKSGESMLLQCLTTDRTVAPNFFSYFNGAFSNRQAPLRGSRFMLM